MTPNRKQLLALAGRVEAATGPDRELADEVLLACGWRLNHDADEIAEWRENPGTCEGEDGKEYAVTIVDRMNWACWYPPSNKPFRDSWIDGHFRPNPLGDINAAMKLVPEGMFPRIFCEAGQVIIVAWTDTVGWDEVSRSGLCQAIPNALTSAALRAIAEGSANG